MAEKDITWLPINYLLAPDYTVTDIVDDVHQTACWSYKNSEQFGCTPERLFVYGNSAGGHVSATLFMDEWQQPFRLPGNVIKEGERLEACSSLRHYLDGDLMNGFAWTQKQHAVMRPETQAGIVLQASRGKTLLHNRQTFRPAEPIISRPHQYDKRTVNLINT